jgi:hypothetical protein
MALGVALIVAVLLIEIEREWLSARGLVSSSWSHLTMLSIGEQTFMRK